MADKSAIEWTDATWNPVTGCTKVSPGCDHCYAETLAERFRGKSGHYFERGFDVVLRPERLGIPLRWRRPRRIFVNSMSDLFHDQVPVEFIAEVFAVMAAAHWHTFQLLTKRHGRMRSLLNDPEFRTLVRCESATLAHEGIDITTNNPWETWPVPNVWLGVSVEDQKRANLRVPALHSTPAAVRWLSCEPLLGPVDLSSWLPREFERQQGGYWLYTPETDVYGNGKQWMPGQALHWVVVGGESGRQARPMHPDWARHLRDQCRAAGVPFFFKQWGEWAPLGPLYEQTADDPEADEARMEAAALELNGVRVIELERSGYVPEGHQPGDPRAWLMARLGKRQAGRDLDGRTWDEHPGQGHQADDAARPSASVHDHSTGFPTFAPDAELVVGGPDGPQQWTGAAWNEYVHAATRAGNSVPERLVSCPPSVCTTTCPANPDQAEG